MSRAPVRRTVELAEIGQRPVRLSLTIEADLFHSLRRLAEREESSIGEVVTDILRRRFGG